MADHTQWWLACPGNTLIWARMRVLESGSVEVFDCDGRTVSYPDETQARMALLDAEFRAWDGMDEDDANTFGFDLDTIAPPEGEDDDALYPQMIQLVPARQ